MVALGDRTGLSFYMPVLKLKRAEVEALEQLEPDVRGHIRPLVDIREPKKLTGSYVKRLLLCRLQDDPPLCIDASSAVGHSQASIRRIALQAAFKFVSVMPVVPLTSSSDYLAEVRALDRLAEFGACLRVGVAAFDDMSATIAKATRLIEGLKLDPSRVDLLIDCETIDAHQAPMVGALVERLHNEWPLFVDARHVVLLGTGFPSTFASVKVGEVHRTPRVEWLAWRQIQDRGRRLRRRPCFGDYGADRIRALVLQNIPKVAPKIVYTSDEQWVIVKASASRRADDGGYPELARRVIGLDEYKTCGPRFSWGDARIFACARGEESTDDAQRWVAVKTSHHLAFVARQVAKLRAS